jgi:hypothetical protein
MPQRRPPAIGPESVCAAMATYPARKSMLAAAINSLLPQVDHLFLYLNNYRHAPNFLHGHKYQEKIHLIVDTTSPHRAAAKFFWLSQYQCYWLLCDDDIIYPPDYAKRMLEALSRHGGRAVVGCHAVVFETKVTNCYASHRSLYLFESALARDRRVHMLGTGTACLHSSLLPADDLRRMLDYPTQNDEILAVTCRKHNIPHISIARQNGWLRSNPRMKYGIYEETMLNSNLQRSVVNVLSEGNPWPDLIVS